MEKQNKKYVPRAILLRFCYNMYIIKHEDDEDKFVQLLGISMATVCASVIFFAGCNIFYSAGNLICTQKLCGVCNLIQHKVLDSSVWYFTNPLPMCPIARL